jgi:hypothetical protein
MGRRAAGPPLSARIGTRHGGERLATGRHVWVDEPPDRPGRHPGLLLEWRQDGAGRAGRVAFAVLDVDRQVVLIQRWLPADHLSPR